MENVVELEIYSIETAKINYQGTDIDLNNFFTWKKLKNKGGNVKNLCPASYFGFLSPGNCDTIRKMGVCASAQLYRKGICYDYSI